jgi:hypothetical protein
VDRLVELRRHIRSGAKGLEIAPYFNPIAPKSQGFDVLILDVFDTDRLRRNASEDPNIPSARVSEIEAVDIVSDASSLGQAVAERGLTGQMDYIVSSHNFEHLPNPIGFLQGCSAALRVGGVLTMAIPDYRACFDHFRAPTRLADWLQAYHEGRTQPAPATIFDFASGVADYVTESGPQGTCRLEYDDPAGFVPGVDLRACYQAYLGRLKQHAAYEDVHCSTVFGDLFHLLVMDLNHLGLTDLQVLEVTETRGHEFIVHLVKSGPNAPSIPLGEYQTTRLALLRRVNAALGSAGFVGWRKRRIAPMVKSGLRRLLGARLVDGLRQWNRRRKRARGRGEATS